MLSARRAAPLTLLAGLAIALTACTSSSSGGAVASGPSSASSAATSGASSTVAVAPLSGTSSDTSTLQTSPSVTSLSSSSSQPTTTSKSTPAPVIKPVAVVSASPAFGTKGITPISPVVIKVAKGKITKLTLMSPTGKVVTGALSKDGTSWTLGEDLGYGKTYTASGSAVGTDSRTVAISGTFTTLTPTTKASSTISPGDGKIVGVADPIVVSFNNGLTPTQRAAIEKRLSIKTSVPVEGAWAWIHHDGYWGVDWRPKVYWPENTTVHVAANLYGIELAPGAYGASDLTSDFTIGRNQVVYADASKHNIVVKQDGKTVATYPASFGSGDSGGEADEVTRSGIYAVMRKDQQVTMTSTKYHYSEQEYWAVRISDNGEFIHENPATVGVQGSANVSHGCINLSEASAKAYFASALIGDPVEVTNTSVKLSPADGDDFDWTIPWSEWLSLSAL